MRRVERIVSGKWSRVAVGLLRAELEGAIRGRIEAALGITLGDDVRVTAVAGDGSGLPGEFLLSELVGVCHRDRASGQQIVFSAPEQVTVEGQSVSIDLDALASIAADHRVPEGQETDKEKRERMRAEIAGKKEANAQGGEESALSAALQRIDQLEQRLAAMERRGAGQNEPKGG